MSLHGATKTCPQVAMHHLNIRPDAKPIKQQQRQFRPNIMEAIEVKVHKLIACGFIQEEQHPDWVANIVPVSYTHLTLPTIYSV